MCLVLSAEAQGLGQKAVQCLIWIPAGCTLLVSSFAHFLRTEKGLPAAARLHCKGGRAFFAAQLVLTCIPARLWQGATATSMPISCFS